MREWEDFQIGGEVYSMRRLGAVSGRKLITRLTRILGALSGEGIGDAASAIAKAVEAVDEETLDHLCKVFGENTRVRLPNGNTPLLTPEIFDEHFVGKYTAMVEWLAVSLRWNYADFFGEQGIGAMVARLKASPSKSPNS